MAEPPGAPGGCRQRAGRAVTRSDTLVAVVADWLVCVWWPSEWPEGPSGARYSIVSRCCSSPTPRKVRHQRTYPSRT